MVVVENLSNAELRDELISHGLTDLGPINNATRSVYIKKLEKLLKQNEDTSSSSTSTKPTKDLTTKRRSMTPPRLTQSQKIASRKSVALPVIFDDQNLNSETENGVNFRKIDKQQPKIIDKNGPRLSSPSRMASKADVVVKPKIIYRLPTFPNEKSTSGGGTAAFSSMSSKPKINDSKIVDDFRSILNDEQSWLKKLSSSSSDATITRRLVADRNKFAVDDDDDDDYRFTTNNGKISAVSKMRTKNLESSFFSNFGEKMISFGAEIYRGSRKRLDYCRNLLGLKPLPDKRYNGPSIELQNFREMRNKYPWITESDRSASANRSLGIKTSATSSRFHRWIKFDQETSRHIMIALLAFLAILSAAYFCTVYKTHVRSAIGHVYGAGVDTVDFVYRNMILPVLVVLLIAMLVYGIFWYKRYKWHKVAEEQRKIFEMVEEIIDILKKHHEECLTSPGDQQTYLAVPHVRDMLIPANRRKELYPIWDKAVEYLNENESRIRTENQCISGEEFMVWRWLQAAHGSQPAREEKVWQGHAFDAEEIHNNSPKMVYFEFLKLRGLFDPDTENEADWPQHIQDAILEKLGSNVRVLHLAVDMRSKDGCVYLKMGSAKEALDAFKVLNGSWFSNHLVSARYLRPERYYERFPDATKAYIPLSVKKARNSLNNRIF